MYRVLVAVALLAACRGGKVRKDADPRGSASAVSDAAISSVVPKLPRSEDGDRELDALDLRIAQTKDRWRSIALRLERASIRGVVEDYQQAVTESATLVAQAPLDERAWKLRVEALTRVHDFAGARVALKKLAAITDPSQYVELELALADATGDVDRAIAERERLANVFPSPQHLTLWAGTLAQAGRADEAIAIIPEAAAAVRDNPPQLLAWLLFQWGRCYELKGELATAREFFAASHVRMPGFLEARMHLAQTMIGTGDTTGARKLVDDGLRDAAPTTAHPELLALAVQLGHTELADAARTEWERYVTALPLAFSDHAARFYLGVGKNPARALELARINHKNRDTREARALVIEAALAAGDTSAACAVVGPLIRTGTRAQRFVAWQALSRCGRTDDADELGRKLGIAQ
jgi:tetratricopeptide (TPR) repeat protein